MPPFSTDLGRIATELPDALIIVDPSGNLLWANEAAINMTGLDPEAWIGQSVFGLMHPDDHTAALDAFVTVADSGRGSLMDIRVRDGGGQWRQCEIRGRFVPDFDPETGSTSDDDGYVIIVLRDVADRRGLELASGDVDLLRALVHHSTSLLLMLDASGAIVTANSELSRSLRRDISKVTGESLDSLMVPADRAAFRDMLRSIDGSATVKVRFRQPDDSIVHVDISVTDLRDDPLVNGFVISGTDVTDLVDSQRALRHMADHDSLTGLLSRRAFMAELEDLVDDGYQHDVVVLFCDLDGFKQVNDRLGHSAGDQVLIEVSRRLEQSVRPTDLIGRLGGDEFVVVLPRADVATAGEVSDRIKAELAEPIFAGDELIALTVSVGSASSVDHPTASGLMTAADHSMYERKHSAREARDHQPT